MYFNGGKTTKDLLVKPKDRDTIWQKGMVIYKWIYDIEWTAKKNTLGSQAEHFQKDIKNT